MYDGPTLLVNIGFDSSYRSDETTIPVPGICDVEALVDTGASESCIDSRLRSSLGLPIIDYQNVSGVHGEKEVALCMAQIDIPALKFTVYGHFAVVERPSRAQLPTSFRNAL
jgi:predicted aspartyl protease